MIEIMFMQYPVSPYTWQNYSGIKGPLHLVLKRNFSENLLMPVALKSLQRVRVSDTAWV